MKYIQMSGKKMGGMSTGETIAIVGGGLLLVYVLGKKPTTPVPILYPPGTLPVSSATATAQEVNAGAGVVNNLINSIFS